jgi:hypothetical protein
MTILPIQFYNRFLFVARRKKSYSHGCFIVSATRGIRNWSAFCYTQGTTGSCSEGSW